MFFDNDLGLAFDEKTLLDGIQGNVLRGYRKLGCRYAFLRFTGPAAEVRAWLKANVAEGPFRPTTAAQQESGAPETCINFCVTADGLRFLGRSVSDMDRAFQRGSRGEETLSLLNDRSPDEWPTEYRAPFHALVLLASDDDVALSKQVAAIRASLDGLGDVHEEKGNALDPQGRVLTDSKAPRHEHFGYRDGLSQLVLLASHWNEIRGKYDGEPAPGRDPRRPLSVALARDPLAGAAGYGSYFVFRKLEQDVTGFRARVAQYMATLKRKGPFLASLWQSKGDGLGYGIFARGMPSDAELERFVLNRVMGRSQDGRPWPSWDTTPPDNLEDFDYRGDAGGRVCPFQAHVRKMNPRGSTGDAKAEQKRTVLRRSLPYGALSSASGRYKHDVGLLFFCAQASIGEQFEFIQRRWANAEDVELSALPTPSVDSLIGQRPRSKDRKEYAEDRHHKISATIEVDMDVYDLVHFRGGEYLFAPSLLGIQNLTSTR